MRRLLAVNAAWDLVIGIALCIIPFFSASVFGFNLKPWWPAFVIAGLLSIAFSVLLLRAARGIRSREICTTAAIANGLGAGAVMLAVSLIPIRNNTTNITLLLIALICAGFAFLEWRHLNLGR